MISKETVAAFTDEVTKIAKLGKVKAGLAATGLVGAGMAAEQAKDDMLQGRRQRIGQARAMGMKNFIGLRT